MNRYQDIESELNKMRKKTFVTVELPVIERSPQDRFIFTNSNDRLDNLAFEFYGDPRHWVVLALANNLGKGTLAVPPGIQLRIPPQSIVTDFLELIKLAQEEK
jgi:nucleoid-associated protein YgaU